MKSNRLQLHTPSSSSTVDWSKFKTKKYLHFDIPLNVRRVKNLIENPDKIVSHAFLPFINFDIIFDKYVLKKRENITAEDYLQKHFKERKETTRSIMYASHLDQFIYKYYGDLLNNAYNDYVADTLIDDAVLAYRNNKKNQRNIDFSAEVFQYILSQQKALIISLDFSGFFDNISHRELKYSIKKVLGEKSLTKDMYHVFKNTTKYSYVTKKKIDEYLINKYGEKELNKLLKEHKLKKIMSNEEFRLFKKNALYKNKKPYGIPQGSGMSAVCSNIHLIDFDKEVTEWVKEHNGLYRRYSDDLIVVIPNISSENMVSYYKEEIMNLIKRYKEYGLDVQSKKTEIRLYKNNDIYDTYGNLASLDYLGLVMDGKNVQLREKSLFKYYSRAYRKAKVCRNITNKTGFKYERRKLYQIYSHLGFNYKGHGNFITYANDAHEKMLSIGLNSNINNQTKRHWSKIQAVLNQ